jgi:hypothetical protein
MQGRYTNPFHVIRAHPMQLGIIDMQACQQVTSLVSDTRLTTFAVPDGGH